MFLGSHCGNVVTFEKTTSNVQCCVDVWMPNLVRGSRQPPLRSRELPVIVCIAGESAREQCWAEDQHHLVAEGALPAKVDNKHGGAPIEKKITWFVWHKALLATRSVAATRTRNT